MNTDIRLPGLVDRVQIPTGCSRGAERLTTSYTNCYTNASTIRYEQYTIFVQGDPVANGRLKWTLGTVASTEGWLADLGVAPWVRHEGSDLVDVGRHRVTRPTTATATGPSEGWCVLVLT